VLAISDYTYVLGGGQVLMADTPARLSASQEFTESFFGAVPQSPKLPSRRTRARSGGGSQRSSRAPNPPHAPQTRLTRPKPGNSGACSPMRIYVRCYCPDQGSNNAR
jgi:hypothetical protein